MHGPMVWTKVNAIMIVPGERKWIAPAMDPLREEWTPPGGAYREQ